MSRFSRSSHRNSIPSDSSTGAAYLFRRGDGGDWRQVGRFQPEDLSQHRLGALERCEAHDPQARDRPDGEADPAALAVGRLQGLDGRPLDLGIARLGILGVRLLVEQRPGLLLRLQQRRHLRPQLGPPLTGLVQKCRALLGRAVAFGVGVDVDRPVDDRRRAQHGGAGLDAPALDDLLADVRGAVADVGPASPLENMELTFAVFDMGDTAYDTMVVLDNWRWNCQGCIPNEVNDCGVQPQ